MKELLKNAALVSVLAVLFFLFPPLCYGSAQEEIIKARPFKGLVRRHMAEQAAYIAATQEGWMRAAHQLATMPAMQFVGTAQGQGVRHFPDVTGLAIMLYTPQITLTGVQGFPPHVEAVQGIELDPPAQLQEQLMAALINPEPVQVYAIIFALRQRYLEAYDAASLPAMETVLSNAGATALEAPVHRALLQLQVLEEYRRIYPRLAQLDMIRENLQKLEVLHRKDPENVLVLVSLGRMLFLLDRPVEALEYVTEGIKLWPKFAQAHDLKGTILLRQRLPALAVQSFTQAIDLEPAYTPYKKNRAAAYLVQEEIAAMCKDLYDACGDGDCEGYKWARRSGKCLPAAANGTDTISASPFMHNSTGISTGTNGTNPHAEPEKNGDDALDEPNPASLMPQTSAQVPPLHNATNTAPAPREKK